MNWEPVWVYLASAVGAVLCAWLWDSRRRTRSLLAGLPHFPALPLIGNLHQIIGDGRLLFKHLIKVSKIVDETMAPFVFWFGPFPLLVIHDPEEVSTVTHAFLEKPYYYSLGRCWLGDGLLLASGTIWKRNIKKLAGAFTSNTVEGYQHVFNVQARKLVCNLKTEVGGAPFHALDKYLAFTTLEAICQTALGLSETSEFVTKEYYDAFNRTMELLLARGLNAFLHLEFIYRLTPAHKELSQCIAVLHSVSETVIAKRKLQRESRKRSQNTDNESFGEPFKSILDGLLDLNERDPSFTEQQIKSEVDTIIVGGQETVAITLFHAMLMIGCKPNVQESLTAEMANIFGDSDRPVETEDLSRMRYCEAVINETLRLFPPLPVIMRYAHRDLVIKSCTIPQGTACTINVWGAGRSVRAWGADAGEFRPERWLDQPAGTLLAFSSGRRACIGKKYAMPFMKTILACCVRELQFESQADQLEHKIDIALRPIAGHLLQVKLRDNPSN